MKNAVPHQIVNDENGPTIYPVPFCKTIHIGEEGHPFKFKSVVDMDGVRYVKEADAFEVANLISHLVYVGRKP